MPFPGLAGSNNSSPGSHVCTEPKRINRAISAGASLGNICSRRGSRLGDNGKFAAVAEMSSTFTAALQSLPFLLTSYRALVNAGFCNLRECMPVHPDSTLHNPGKNFVLYYSQSEEECVRRVPVENQ
jgi:hypothetical protein